MRRAGFPCRVTGCDLSFLVADQSSMAALTAASQERTVHEISIHGYRHVSPPEPSAGRQPWVTPRKPAK